MSLNSSLRKIGRYGRQTIVALEQLGPLKYYPLLFTLLAAIFLASYRFVGLEAFFYDGVVRTDLRPPSLEEFRYVLLDEESDELLGEKFPYSYFGHLKMMRRLLEAQPKVIVSFVPFPNPQTAQQTADMVALRALIDQYQQAGGHFYFGQDYGAWSIKTLPKIFQDLPRLFSVINADENNFAQDKVVRRAILQVGQEQALHLQVANELRQAQGKAPLAVEEVRGSTYLPNTDTTYFLFRLGHAPGMRQLGQAATFFEVINGHFFLPEWHQKIVLIGPSYEERPGDLVKTPLERQQAYWPQIFLHGQMMAAIAQNKGVAVARPWWAVSGMLLFATLLIVIILHGQPGWSLGWTLAILVAVLLVTAAFFNLLGWWVSPVGALCLVLLVYFIWMPFRAMLEYQGRTAVEEEAKMWQQLEGLKRNFISLMSHDLKTPVAKVASLAEVLQHQLLGQEEARKNVQAILKTTKDLNQFISVILDLAKAEARAWQVQAEHKDLNQLLEKILQHYQQDLVAAKMQWSLDLAPLYPIEMDETLMQRVMANLVENAIRYAGEGKTLTISTREEGDWIYATVADNGPGIRSEDLPFIFDKFFRGKHPTGKGTGLGLYLVKYFVELLGGKIKVESQWGRGTSFILQMPNR